jgi:hypothetical protein
MEADTLQRLRRMSGHRLLWERLPAAKGIEATTPKIKIAVERRAGG